jgi:soluble lytic murein transglycosylase-like protein
MKIPTWAWWLGGGTVLALILFRKKDEIVSGVTEALQTGAGAVGALTEAVKYVPIINQVSNETGVPASIIAAIMWRESMFGLALTPPGPTGTGDGGHGRGLMQIDDRYWTNWLAQNDWTDPYTNIKQGALIWQQKRNFFMSQGSGTVNITAGQAAKLNAVSGPYPDPRPIYDDAALNQAATAAYNAGEGGVLAALAAGMDPDLMTTGKNYSNWVLAQVGVVANSLGLV